MKKLIIVLLTLNAASALAKVPSTKAFLEIANHSRNYVQVTSNKECDLKGKSETCVALKKYLWGVKKLDVTGKEYVTVSYFDSLRGATVPTNSTTIKAVELGVKTFDQLESPIRIEIKGTYIKPHVIVNIQKTYAQERFKINPEKTGEQ